jgi:RNA polymerase sigma factor (sigma-70 family)
MAWRCTGTGTRAMGLRKGTRPAAPLHDHIDIGQAFIGPGDSSAISAGLLRQPCPETGLRPYLIPMHDREIVAAIVEGDATGLAAAFGQYARGLYAYGRSQLTEPAEAADAVQDAFLIASAKVSGLREPDRLRAWLFAVARNECHRRLRADAASAPLDEAAEITDDTEHLDAEAEQAELRALVRAAVAGLNPEEREIIELNLRHELYGADLADILGVPRKQAQALASRARSQFETSLDALLVARSGREHCRDLATILDGWDGELTVPQRKRVKRHIERCEACGDRKRRQPSPAMLLTLLPLAVLPGDLGQRLFQLVADVSPGGATHLARVGDRAEPLGAGGFPLQLTTPSSPRWPGSYVMAAVAAVAALALLGGGMLYVDYTAGHGVPPAAAAARTPTPGPTGSSRSTRALAVTPSAPDPSPAPISTWSATLAAPVREPSPKTPPKKSKSPSPSPSATHSPARPTSPPPTSPSPTPTPHPTTPSPTPTPHPTTPSPTTTAGTGT